MDQFCAHLHHLQHHRSHQIEFRNCWNKCLYDGKVNSFLAISDTEMLGTGEKHHGFMLESKSCLLYNIFVCDTIFIGILI